METITITVNVNGNSVSRNYSAEYTPAFKEMSDAYGEESSLVWGERVLDMLDTLEKSNEKEF